MRESQQIAGVFSIFAHCLPWPHGDVQQPEFADRFGAQLLPLTSPVMMLIRLGFGPVPAGQVAISLALLWPG